MQVTETSSSGLKRELKVVVGHSELSDRFTARIDEVKDQIQLKGFRKGKVPLAHVKKLYGRSVMAEVVQQTVEETSRKAVQDRNERPAHQPNIDFTEDKEEIEKVLSGQGDLAFTMKFEILPSITVTDLSALKLEREVADVADEAVDKAVADLVERSIKHEPEAERSAGKGDRLTIDFVGRIDGVEFDGGKGEDVQLVVGEGQFIPGFVEGLEGAKAGEERLVKVKFPDDYPGKEVAGKDAEFTVNVKEVAKPVRPEVNDDFAKTLGAQSLDQLKELVRGKIAGEYASVARMKIKRQALDALDKAHDFALPETLVNGEFEGIWRQFTQSLEVGGQDHCRRRQAGGGAAGRIPQDRRAARAAGAGDRRDRRQAEAAGEPGRAQARPDRAGAALSGPGAHGLRVLREEPGGARGAAGADLRGQGHRPYSGGGQAGGEESYAGGTAQARGGRRRCVGACASS